MEPEDTLRMSGSNSICVATVLLDGGIIPMQDPVAVSTGRRNTPLMEVAMTRGKRISECVDARKWARSWR